MSGIARWGLHLALVAAISAFVVAREDRRALLLFVPLALAPGLGARRVPRLLARAVTLATAIAVALAFAHAVAARSVLVSDEVARGWAAPLGIALAALGVVLAFGHPEWRAESTLLPVVVALLTLSSIGEANPLYSALALAAAGALWLFAFVQGGPRRLDRRLFGFAAASAAACAGIVLFLPWAQPRLEGVVAARLGEGVTGFAETSRLGEFERLARSRRLVLRVWTSHPRRLRASSLTRFDGREWTPAPHSVERENARPVLPLPEAAGVDRLSGAPGSLFLLPPNERPPAPNDGVVETLVLPVRSLEWPVLHPADAVLVRARASRLEPTGSGGVRWPRLEDVPRYEVLSRLAPPGRSGARLSDAERAETLELPASLDPRLRIRARILADGAASDRERMARTVAWLRSDFVYALDVGPFRTDDPVAEFLLEKKRGYCSFFATAAAVLLRLQGVPTRYVKGFDVGPRNRVVDHYRVEEGDAHAWIEAWLPGEGWVEADPTPQSGFAALDPSSPSALGRFAESVRARAALAWAAFRGEGPGGGLAVMGEVARDLVSAINGRPHLLGVLLGAAAAFGLLGLVRVLLARWRSLRRPGRSSLPPDVRALVESVERLWARAGRVRPPTRGLLEHLESIPAAALSPASREASARAIDAVYLCAFGGRPLPAAEVAALRRELARLG